MNLEGVILILIKLKKIKIKNANRLELWMKNAINKSIMKTKKPLRDRQNGIANKKKLIARLCLTPESPNVNKKNETHKKT